jgi:hypothetical protein
MSITFAQGQARFAQVFKDLQAKFGDDLDYDEDGHHDSID